MEIRKSQINDIDSLMDIYHQARSFMQQSGNPGQWINGYPSREIILQDIQAGHSYVCLNQQKEIIGTFCFTQQIEDPTYLRIDNGQWLNNEPYGVIHRLAAGKGSKGLADYCFNWCFQQIQNIRVDTHKDNKVMQHILKKNGYTLCGIIYTANGGERLAFQKIK